MKQPEDLPVPSTERQRLVIEVDLALLALAARLRQHWSNHAAAVGLSTAQVKVLLLMKPGQAVPMRVLATQLDQDASNFRPVAPGGEAWVATTRSTCRMAQKAAVVQCQRLPVPSTA